MTGEIVGFSGGQTPSSEDERALAAAKACFPEHDPFQPVLDLLDRVAARINKGLVERPLTAEQLEVLTYSVGMSAQQGVGRYADRISSWRAMVVGALAGGGLIFGAAITHTIDIRAADARMESARIEVPAVFGELTAAEATAWSRIIRSNPPPAAWASRQQPIAAAEGKAAWVPLWLEPPPRPTPGAH